MRFAFFTGWVLIIAALASAAAETLVRAIGGGGWVTSAAELWQGIWPASYLFARQRLAAIDPALWDAAIGTVLALPAWLLLGVPGVVLAWCCRASRTLTPVQEEELREQEASLFLYDELAREARQWARDSGEQTGEDDRLPTHDLVDLLEKDGEDIDPFEDVRRPLPDFVKPPER